MEFNKNVSNPMLVGAIELMKAEDTPEHRNMFVAELVKASFLSPALVEPAPAENAEGNEKWQEKNQKLPFFALKIEDYAAMILRRDPKGNICPALGMVINPLGSNMIIPREMLAGMMSAKMAQAKQAAEKQKK